MLLERCCVASCDVQLGFINFIVTPLWTAVVQHIPEQSEVLEFLSANKAKWSEMAEGKAMDAV